MRNKIELQDYNFWLNLRLNGCKIRQFKLKNKKKKRTFTTFTSANPCLSPPVTTHTHSVLKKNIVQNTRLFHTYFSTTSLWPVIKITLSSKLSHGIPGPQRLCTAWVVTFRILLLRNEGLFACCSCLSTTDTRFYQFLWQHVSPLSPYFDIIVPSLSPSLELFSAI